MKKFTALVLVALMLVTFVPFGAFAAEAVRYEAEAATITKQDIRDGTDSTVSGAKFVGGFDNKGNYATFKVTAAVAGDYELAIGYISCQVRSFDITVNETAINNVECTEKGSSWTGDVKVKTITVTLVAGENTIVFGQDSGTAPSLDYIEISPVKVIDPIPVGTRLSYTAEAVADAQARTKHWNQGTLNGTIDVKIVDGKGVNGSDAIEIVRHYTGNQGRFEFILNIENGGKLGDNKYLVVWADFTNIDFAKACFGLATDGNTAQAYRTDDKAGVADLPFYYLADGATDWEVLDHGNDECFGSAQDSSIKGKKGYFAFPVADFVMGEQAKTPLTSDSNITGVYIFANTDVYPEVAFYIDDIQLIDDYKNVKAPETPVEPETPVDPAPTGDMTIALVTVALVSLAAVTVIAKKKVNE